jgi:hypothetical protein
MFSMPFGSIYHVRTFIPRQNRHSINMVKNGADPNNNLGIQIFSYLDILIKYQYLTGITILLPTGKFFDTIIVVHY